MFSSSARADTLLYYSPAEMLVARIIISSRLVRAFLVNGHTVIVHLPLVVLSLVGSYCFDNVMSICVCRWYVLSIFPRAGESDDLTSSPSKAHLMSLMKKRKISSEKSKASQSGITIAPISKFSAQKANKSKPPPVIEPFGYQNRSKSRSDVDDKMDISMSRSRSNSPEVKAAPHVNSREARKERILARRREQEKELEERRMREHEKSREKRKLKREQREKEKENRGVLAVSPPVPVDTVSVSNFARSAHKKTHYDLNQKRKNLSPAVDVVEKSPSRSPSPPPAANGKKLRDSMTSSSPRRSVSRSPRRSGSPQRRSRSSQRRGNSREASESPDNNRNRERDVDNRKKNGNGHTRTRARNGRKSPNTSISPSPAHSRSPVAASRSRSRSPSHRRGSPVRSHSRSRSPVRSSRRDSRSRRRHRTRSRSRSSDTRARR